MGAIIDSMKSGSDYFYPKTKTSAVYDDSNNRLDNTLTSLNDSLTKRYTQLVSTSSNIVINVNTTQYKEFFIEYIVGNSANVPFFIPYGCKRNTRYRVHYKNDYANITFTDSTIEIGIANTEYTGTTVNILAR